MTLNESDTRSKLIDPAIHARGWMEDFIKREVSAAAVEIIDSKLRNRDRVIGIGEPVLPCYGRIAFEIDLAVPKCQMLATFSAQIIPGPTLSIKLRRTAGESRGTELKCQ